MWNAALLAAPGGRGAPAGRAGPEDAAAAVAAGGPEGMGAMVVAAAGGASMMMGAPATISDSVRQAWARMIQVRAQGCHVQHFAQ